MLVTICLVLSLTTSTKDGKPDTKYLKKRTTTGTITIVYLDMALYTTIILAL